MIDPEELQDQLGLGDLPEELTSSANISPGQQIPVVLDTDTRGVRMFKWGLVPGWAKDSNIGNKIINARAETIDQKPSFREVLLKKRCLIPADGFYEWRLEGSKKVPYLFTLADRRSFTFAGLWELWREPDGKNLHTCTIITTTPNELLSNYHNRMPVILSEKSRWEWMSNHDAATLVAMLRPYPSELMANPIVAYSYLSLGQNLRRKV